MVGLLLPNGGCAPPLENNEAFEGAIKSHFWLNLAASSSTWNVFVFIFEAGKMVF